MKKILQIVDTPDWAIGHLATAIMKRNPQYNWRQIVVHPKALERGELDLLPIREAILWADLIDVQYWRSGSQLLNLIPEMKDKKIVLTHQNDENLLSADWSDVDMLIARTKYAFDVLNEKYPGKVSLCPIGIDIASFPYHGQDPKNATVGYVGRIVPWKGLKDIAQACYELGYPLLVMGKMDKPSYWESIPMEHRNNMILDWFNCEDFERLEAYHNMTIYVGNSGPRRESGTMPYMEAMAVGVPIVTTPSGIAADVGRDKENALIVPFNDYDALKEAIKELMEFPSLRDKLREAGWETVKNLNWDRMAHQYNKIYSYTLSQNKTVSAIIPTTYDRLEHTKTILTSLNAQTHKHIEAIIVFDEFENEALLNRDQFNYFCQQLDIPVKILFTDKEDDSYNLAKARNLGVIEAIGDYILFCDSRINPHANTVELFYQKAVKDEADGLPPVWYFGEKGGNKKTFVENFSFIKRSELVKAGMFNERVNKYGGMSQELRSRFDSQGFRFEYMPEVKADQLIRSSSRNDKRRASIIEMKNLLAKLGL